MHRTLRAGFALIELLVVVVIIGLLMAFIIPNLIGSKEKKGGKRVLAPKQRAQQVGTVSYAGQINQALLMYRQDNDDRNPATLAELKAYGVTDEMLYDQVTKQPIPYDPRTGRVGNSGPADGRLGGVGADGKLPIFENPTGQ